MKKILFTTFVSICFFITNAQLSLSTNDKLIYDVSAGGADYNFTIKIKSLTPGFNFAWQMTNEDASYGIIKVLPAAMATSKKMHNYFSNGNKTLTDATSVILSKAAYKEIIEKKKVTLEDGMATIVFENPDETSFSYRVNGVEKNVPAIYLSAENGNDIVVLKNPTYPLILRMNLGWTIQLNNIVTANKKTTDLSEFIGRKIFDGAFLWDKLDKSSVVKTEDLTGVGEGSGPSIYNEYFSHLEGLWVKTYNDTVTDIIYYPTAMLHSDHTYYGGDISIPQVTSFSFNRTQAKTFVKTKFLEKSSYDTDIYQASSGTTMELYYHVPVKIKNGIEFGIAGSSTPKSKQLLGFITFQKK